MAVNQDVIGIRAGIAEKAVSRAREHRFFLLVGLLFPLIVIGGFIKNYYLRPLFPEMGPMYSDLVRFHAAIMTAWVLLFAAQAWLVSAKKVKLHMKLGWAGVGLAVLVLVTGYLVAIASAQRGNSVPNIPPDAFLIVPIMDLALFVIFFGGAIYLRKSPAEHKRLMLLSAANFLPPAAARLPIDVLQSLGPWWLFGLPTALTIGALTYDTWLTKKLNKVFFAGSILLIASFPFRLWFGGTETWLTIARWLTS